jgi:hypothetical protein
MASHGVFLPSRTFKSKSEAVTFFKEMLNRYKDSEEIRNNDDTLLYELLQRHPNADEKIGVGVEVFYRDRSPIHPSSCFHIERKDGTTTDFSYKSCISGNAISLYQQFYEACRFSVSQELINQKNKLFRDANGILPCSRTGVLIKINEADYRHTSPAFREIVRGFVDKYSIKISHNLLTKSSDMQYVTRFADTEIEKLFKNYHKSHSNLAIFKKLD